MTELVATGKIPTPIIYPEGCFSVKSTSLTLTTSQEAIFSATNGENFDLTINAPLTEGSHTVTFVFTINDSSLTQISYDVTYKFGTCDCSATNYQMASNYPAQLNLATNTEYDYLALVDLGLFAYPDIQPSGCFMLSYDVLDPTGQSVLGGHFFGYKNNRVHLYGTPHEDSLTLTIKVEL